MSSSMYLLQPSSGGRAAHRCGTTNSVLRCITRVKGRGLAQRGDCKKRRRRRSLRAWNDKRQIVPGIRTSSWRCLAVRPSCLFYYSWSTVASRRCNQQLPSSESPLWWPSTGHSFNSTPPDGLRVHSRLHWITRPARAGISTNCLD